MHKRRELTELAVARGTRVKVATRVAMIARSLAVASSAIVAVVSARVVRRTVKRPHGVLMRACKKFS